MSEFAAVYELLVEVLPGITVAIKYVITEQKPAALEYLQGEGQGNYGTHTLLQIDYVCLLHRREYSSKCILQRA